VADDGSDEQQTEQAAGLADRLRALKVRDVAEVDEAELERAQASKASLAERMRSLVAEGAALGGASHPAAPGTPAPATDAGTAHSPPAPPVAPPLDLQDEGKGFAERLRRLSEEASAATAGTTDSGPPKRALMRWFLGRASQAAGSGAITAMRPVDTSRWEEVEFYPIEPPYSFVRILHDKHTGEHLYEALEPQLSKDEQEILQFVEDALVRGLNVDPSTLKPEHREEYLVKAVRQILHDYRIRIDQVGQARVEYYLRRDFLGLGPIHAVMVDPNIEDISCDGAAQPLFIFHRQYESIPSTIRFTGEAELDGFVIRLAQRSGKAISISEPILDAALPDGSRLQATLGREVTQNGSTFTIRRFKPDPFTPLDLVGFGTMDLDLLAWFWMIVQYGYSLIFSGGTASGKTTGLNAISQFIPPSAKVVSIEDTREVNLPHKNWIKSVTRSGSTSEGTGEIGMFELLKASLRQRPEYILVGEVRGVEATVAFQAMATGHTVYSTMHADSARSVVYRLENDPINIPRLVLQALDVIAIQAQTRVHGKRVRRILEVVELVGMDPATKELLTNTVYKWDPATDRFEYAGRSYMLERIAQERNWTRAQVRDEHARRKKVLAAMIRRGVKDVRELTDLVKAYYRDPEGMAARLGDGSEAEP
jgi:archaeal flagellar protein FlaI